MRPIIILCLVLVLSYQTQSASVHVGQCPLNSINYGFAFSPETFQEQCAANSLCCMKDNQYPQHQKSCGCVDHSADASVARY